MLTNIEMRFKLNAKKRICRTKRNKSFRNVENNFVNGVDYSWSHSAKYYVLAVGFIHVIFTLVV